MGVGVGGREGGRVTRRGMVCCGERWGGRGGEGGEEW